MIRQLLLIIKQALEEFIRGIQIKGNIRIQIPVNKPKLLPAKRVVKKTKKIIQEE